MVSDLYVNGEYLKKNPNWHLDESHWKAREILSMLAKNALAPATICEIGCGAGEILSQLQQQMQNGCLFWGYEISPQAFELCQSRMNDRLQFKLADVRQEENATFDLVLVMDVLEHLEDCFSFLREIKPKSQYKIFQIPMDLSVQSILFGHVIEYRERYGHVHYFTKEIALEMLKDAGYEILDYFYTEETVTSRKYDAEMNLLRRLRRQLGNVKLTLCKLPGRLLFAINQDVAVRMWGHWGQWRLLILTK